MESNKPISNKRIAQYKNAILTAPGKIEILMKYLGSPELHTRLQAIDKLTAIATEVKCAQSHLRLIERRNQISIFRKGSQLRFAEVNDTAAVSNYYLHRRAAQLEMEVMEDAIGVNEMMELNFNTPKAPYHV